MEVDEAVSLVYLLSVEYDGKARKAKLRLLDTSTQRLIEIYDWTGHKPYLLTDLSPEELVENSALISSRGFDHIEVVEKFNPLTHEKVLMSKVVARDPLSVGGTRNSMRDILTGHAWEAHIKYNHNYIFDTALIPGMMYRLENNKLELVDVEVPKNVVETLAEIYNYDEKIVSEAVEWAKLLQAPIPPIKRLAIDIEVYTEGEHVPSPQDPRGEVIAVSMAGSDGFMKIFILRRPDKGEEIPSFKSVDGEYEVEIEYFDSEKELLEATMKILDSYPLILTFNGDNFDLPYLRERARRLGIPEENIPIIPRPRDRMVTLRNAIHIDLYRFFNNRSMQVYAFGNKYRDVKTLNEIAKALLGIGKIYLEKRISELNYKELAEYCFNDAYLTLKLTQFSGDLVINLMFLLMRISKLPLDDLTRHNISAWIKNMMYFEHRKLGYLIPRPEDIKHAKGGTATKAIIKGKKYMGAIVIDPLPGVFFNVVVVDFASLYPSVIKRWNLSYETVRCPHEECRKNKVPGTPHWVCRKVRGLTSKIIGFLRDLRVYIYKPLSKKEKDPTLRNQFKVIQQALKVFINASYGVFGAETFPLYCPPMAECTTALGRYSIARTVQLAHNLDLPILYGDTDSLFLWNPPEDKLKKLIKQVMGELQIDLDIDKEYMWVAFSGRKKNYLGILKGGSIDVKGLLGKKRNTPEFLKQVFMDVAKTLSSAKNVEELEKALEDVKQLVIKSYNNLKNSNYSLDELAIRVTLSKNLDEYTKTTPQHIKAARLLTRYGRRIEMGDIISFVKTRDKLGVKPVELARIDEIDVEKYIEHMKTALEQVLEALDINFESLVGNRLLESFLIA